MKQFIAIAFTIALALSIVAPASATLIGDTVTFEGLGTSFAGQSATVVVGAGVEFSLTDNGAVYDVDVDANSITITADFTNSPDFGAGWGSNGFGTLNRALRVSSLDWVGSPAGEIIGIQVTGTSFLNPPFATFGPHEVDIANQSENTFTFFQGSFVRIGLETSDNTSVVPEPITATLGLMGLGVLGMTTRCRAA